MTGSTHDPWGFRRTDDPEVHERLVERINRKVLDHRSEIVEVESYHAEGELDLLVISYGFTARSALFAVEALRSEGKKVGLLRLKTLWPFPEGEVAEMASRARRVFVPEMNLGQVAGEVRKYVPSEVLGYNQTNGEVIDPRTLIEEMRRTL